MKKNILIVDDEKEIVEELVDIFTDEGYDVSFAYDGEAALEKYKNDNFDFVLLDIKMPKMGGLETYRKIRKINSNASVLIMTGSFAKESANQALKEGAVDAIFKPFSADKLLRTIKKYI